MKWFLIPVVCVMMWLSVAGQQTVKQTVAPLPQKMFLAMRDSTTSMDVIMLLGKGGSLSLEGRNVKMFNSFFENKPAQKTGAPLAGNIMWLMNGREYISGSFFLGDSTGYVVFTKEGREYVNLLNNQGNSFFKSQMKL